MLETSPSWPVVPLAQQAAWDQVQELLARVQVAVQTSRARCDRTDWLQAQQARRR